MDKPDVEFEQLLEFLRDRRAFDFTGYKRTSLMRRLNRQMQVAGCSSYGEYQDYLEVHPEEFTPLFNTILINVTAFFRDPDAWTYLREVLLPDLLQSEPSGVLRIWSAGCASGEEAYSLAILFADLLGPDEFRERVKIYATDVDEDALTQARHGSYDERQVSGLSAEQLATYFEQSNGRYVFRKDLRRCVIFGRNDLVQDAPISRINLLVCRNTLMYFNAEQQQRIVRRLHFAINPRGILFLGKAEMLLSHGESFEPIDLRRRFFRKISSEAPRDRGVLVNGTVATERGNGPGVRSARLRDEALNTSPLAHLVLDANGQLVLGNQRADVLFGISGRDLGKPFRDLEISYRPIELRTSIDRVMTDRRPVWVRDVEWPRPGGDTAMLDVQIVPLADQDGPLLGVSILFNDVTRYRHLRDELEHANRQLASAYEELQSTNEELETTNEELQSTVEELETTNEELQSTNEELETMNEELQSMNDELQSSNDELRLRTDEVGHLNRFMQSILASLRAAVAVVDRELQVQMWNEGAEDMWGLRPDEAVGQHLLNLDIGLPVEQLRPLVRRMLVDGSAKPDEAELQLEAVNRRGKTIQVRVSGSPLRGAEGHITGTILLIEQQEPR